MCWKHPWKHEQVINKQVNRWHLVIVGSSNLIAQDAGGTWRLYKRHMAMVGISCMIAQDDGGTWRP